MLEKKRYIGTRLQNNHFGRKQPVRWRNEEPRRKQRGIFERKKRHGGFAPKPPLAIHHRRKRRGILAFSAQTVGKGSVW